MFVELTCVACGTLFAPSREDLWRGPRWYTRCPDCRVVPTERADPESAPAASPSAVSVSSKPGTRVPESPLKLP
jgi:hypothetical protein